MEERAGNYAVGSRSVTGNEGKCRIYDKHVLGICPKIPPLPVLVPLVIITFGTMVWRLHRRGEITVIRVAVVAIACVYGAGLLNSVLLPFPICTGAARDGLVSWRLFVQLIPLLTADPIGVVLNVELFVPLGALLPLVARVSSVRRAVTIGFLLSLGIELAQFVADITVSTGRVLDVNDLGGNTIGVFVGYVIFRVAVCVPAVARTAAAATWPAAPPPAEAIKPRATTH
jgi:glycopeptide antibiotics resistance protein